MTSDELLQSFRGQPIAIVGNGPIAKNFGRAIDLHKVVIRLNNFLVLDRLARGERCSHRCISGWFDLRLPAPGIPEFSPWRYYDPESNGLRESYGPRSAGVVLVAQLDVHPEIPETPNPSTGLALAQLCEHYEIEADYFGFDHFAVGPTTHNGTAERAAFARMRYARMIT